MARSQAVKNALPAVVVGLLATPAAAVAQAWLPSAGDASLTITYQSTSARGELDRNGEPYWEEGVTRAQIFTPEIDWGISDRIALSLTFPLIAGRYRGEHAHDFGHHGPGSSIDDGNYHGGTQDVRIAVRYALTRGPVAVAPFAEGVVPSRHYEYTGHAAVGDGLRLFRAGANVGGFLDRVTPGLYFHTQLSFTLAEKLVGIRTNRSRLESEVGYFVTPRFSVRFVQTLVITHDGLNFPEARFLIPEFVFNHDPLKKRKFLSLGGGVSFTINETVGVFAAAMATPWGHNVHPVRGISTGLTYQIRTGGVAPVASRHARSPSTPQAARRRLLKR